MAASEAVVDFTNVKERGEFNTRRQPEGDYKGKITKVTDAESKKDGVKQWVFTIEAGKGTYPYYCKHEENQYWKIRNLLVAAGKSVPKKRVKVNPNDLVGKEIGVTLEDDEYDGKPKSVIASVMPLSELDSDDLDDEDEDADTDTDEDEDTPPARPAKAKPADDDDDDEDDEDEAPVAKGDHLSGLDRTELKQYIAAKKLQEKVTVKKSMSDDEIRSAIRSAETAGDDDDDDLEEIDIDD